MMATGSPSAARGDAILALVVGLVLTLGWAFTDRAALAALRLPDTDDMMRLAQIRDWLGGQAYMDLTQYRLGPGGLAMHWSRVPDLVPAALIATATPMLGQPAAERLATIAWPAMLFIAYLWLAATIARRIGTAAEAPVAIVVAALAYPAISLFIPGRIDHHGLQMGLLLVVVLGLVERSSLRSGAISGGAAALSLMVGLETAPAMIAAMAALFVLWSIGGGAEKSRLVGFGAGLLAMLGAGLLIFRPRVWPASWCDSFTPGVAIALAAAGMLWLILGIMTPRLGRPLHRAAAGLLGALIAGGLLYALAPACFANPYGRIDPLLAQIWLANVGEAGGVLAQRPGTLIAYLGLPIGGLTATAWFLRREPDRRPGWGVLLMVQAASIAVATMQLRGAYVAAALAAPALAHLIVTARPHGLARLSAAWLVSAGLVWQQLGDTIGSETSSQPAIPLATKAGCTDPRTIAQIGRLPVGMLAAPIDLGAFIIGMTGHRVLAAPITATTAATARCTTSSSPLPKPPASRRRSGRSTMSRSAPTASPRCRRA